MKKLSDPCHRIYRVKNSSYSAPPCLQELKNFGTAGLNMC